MSPQITDKHGQPINKGDHVYTPFRGGRHEGDAEQIVTTDDEARQAKVKKPPKVSTMTLSYFFRAGMRRTTVLTEGFRLFSQTKMIKGSCITRKHWRINQRLGINSLK